MIKFFKLALLFILFLCENSIGQDKVHDVVILKSGINIVGSIIELVPNEFIIMYDTRGKEIKINFSDVERIEKKNFNLDRYLDTPIYPEEENLRYNMTFYVNGGLNFRMDELETSYNLNIISNFNFKQFGFGPGFNFTNLNKKNMLTLLGDLRYTFLYKTIKPYFFVNAGYTFLDSTSRGPMIKFGSGIRYQISKNISVSSEIGFMFKNFRYDLINNYYTNEKYSVAGTYRSVMFNTGLVINLF